MLDLFLSILCSSLIFVVFKLFDTYRVATFHAIVANYLTALLTGLALYGGSLGPSELPQQPWLAGAAILGGIFILIFNLMARTSQRLGVSVASIATKMSLVIPVIAGLLLYGEHLSAMKVLGILMALVAVYFASLKNEKFRFSRRALYLPFFVFLGSGVIDTSIKYLQATQVPEAEYPIFSATIFGFAALTGLGVLLLRSPADLLRWRPANLLGGIVLGVPNYFSIYFLLRALQHGGLNSASVFTLNNVTIVMLTTLLGILLFRETMSPKNWMGVALAVLSIVVISLF
ncbi:DMT family transporter [Robiginitalea marina]|uniref:DMT family transporter n=1 Tax=Robiginitalea marina TaxID=2954105 RepID=A0ABT1AVV5_9FLAO|nr:DMT family transporter [Robiginitalea marina]MCO5723747.1 DMT family transporter [Robiginitalea marina]